MMIAERGRYGHKSISGNAARAETQNSHVTRPIGMAAAPRLHIIADRVKRHAAVQRRDLTDPGSLIPMVSRVPFPNERRMREKAELAMARLMKSALVMLVSLGCDDRRGARR